MYRQPPEPDPAHTDPAVLGALLARHGWRRHGGSTGRYARFTPPGDAPGGAGVLVPADRAFPDCTDLLAEALTALARSPEPSAPLVLTAVAVPSDEVSWEYGAERRAGPARWADAERLSAAARAMLLAGALAARRPAGFHGARLRPHAARDVEQTLLGPGAHAARLTAFVPAPESRAVTTMLLRALRGTRDAVDRHHTTGAMDAFDHAVELGVCHELAEALTALVRGTDGVRITLAWAPAYPPPQGFAPVPEPVEFTPGDIPALQRAAVRYRHREPSLPVRLTAAVTRLSRTAATGPGRVRLRVLAGADVTEVRTSLDEEAYRVAGQAHLAGVPVRLSGMLESRGGFRRLTGASGVRPVPVADAEGNRLPKAHEHLDFLDEAYGDG
ncbi:hypothetical protein OG946_04600 [Streptomyces sp. NBC_01808]|uniref:hypothetical protein n=1 Tax=Streptomyces sp. NBC_01808 TaxID=2975947 RepID=UPI002DD99FB0|nr:hypothetical protein [Streptomyces sp. NBC_01808]WSA36731.1 hypothetical protein OG946_04600 [Streptomyces sp. NBC_01808]